MPSRRGRRQRDGLEGPRANCSGALVVCGTPWSVRGRSVEPQGIRPRPEAPAGRWRARVDRSGAGCACGGPGAGDGAPAIVTTTGAAGCPGPGAFRSGAGGLARGVLAQGVPARVLALEWRIAARVHSVTPDFRWKALRGTDRWAELPSGPSNRNTEIPADGEPSAGFCLFFYRGVEREAFSRRFAPKSLSVPVERIPPAISRETVMPCLVALSVSPGTRSPRTPPSPNPVVRGLPRSAVRPSEVSPGPCAPDHARSGAVQRTRSRTRCWARRSRSGPASAMQRAVSGSRSVRA